MIELRLEWPLLHFLQNMPHHIACKPKLEFHQASNDSLFGQFEMERTYAPYYLCSEYNSLSLEVTLIDF